MDYNNMLFFSKKTQGMIGETNFFTKQTQTPATIKDRMICLASKIPKRLPIVNA
jgi:hypothetical protein